MRQIKFSSKTPREFKASRKDSGLEILVYDIIGRDLFGGGVTAQDIADKLDEAGKLESITLRINSPGGDLFEGLTIQNLLQSKGLPVNVFVDGEAASAATIVMLAGNTITMGEGSMLFIHNAWTLAAGNAVELRKTADDLEKISGEMRKLYAERTGIPEQEIQALMDAETFLTAEEAVAKKFADNIATTKVETSAKSPESLTRAQFEHELSVL